VIVPHLREIADPEAGTGELVNAVRLGTSNHLLERALDGSRVGSLAADPHGLLEQSLIKHNIRAFHV
jgi:hypothetical protein